MKAILDWEEPSYFNPGAAPIVDASFRRKLLNTFPYALIYRFDIDEIVVVAVANLKRRPGYWRRRVH